VIKCLLPGRSVITAGILLLTAWTMLHAVQKPSYVKSSGFFTLNGKLYDANGVEFIPRGVNNPHVWSDDYGQFYAYQALSGIARLKTNCIRIVWETSRMSVDHLENVIKKVIDLKMIPMIELHDVTGKTGEHDLLRMADFYIRGDVKPILSRYEKHLLVNIANEWGDHGTSDTYWRDTYKKAVKKMRDAGIDNLLVIDAPAWGQGSWAILNQGQRIIDSDPQKNILFDLHMYATFNPPANIGDVLQAFVDKKLPLVIGEFGYNHNNGNNNLQCKVDAREILKQCQNKGIGYIAWSWSGNNSENSWLDLSNNYSHNSLTWWGKLVFESANGITATARQASVFSKTASTIRPIPHQSPARSRASIRLIATPASGLPGPACGLDGSTFDLRGRRLQPGSLPPRIMPVQPIVPGETR
jgi:mannan endo-1,4-beta-mannosidase